MRYRAILRWKELYYPTTHNFLIFLALLSLTAFIFSSFFEFIIGWSNRLGITDVPIGTPLFAPTPTQATLAVIGTLSALISLWALLSLFCVILLSIIGVRPRPAHEQFVGEETKSGNRKERVLK